MHRFVLISCCLALGAACGSDPDRVELLEPDPQDDRGVDPETGEPGPARHDETFAAHLVLTTTLSLGGRGAGVLCPAEQEIHMGVTSLVRRTHDGDRVHEEATLCALELPRFTVSAHGAIGGCDETREAQLDVGFDVAAIGAHSSLDARSTDAGDALPMAFVLGAALEDPFTDDLPGYAQPELLRDDDGDGQAGVTFVATGLPVLDDGAQIYGALRLLVTPTAEGRAEAGFALSLVGSNAGLSGRTLEVLSPTFESGLEVELDRAVVGEDTTCAELVEVPPVW